jgi:hypothetical protein
VVKVGDCRDVLATMPEASFDSVVTDPPYELGFMGREWDRTGVAFDPETWGAVLRVLRPGGYMLAMGGTRTYHRLACAVEDAGFEVRDCLMWVYGTGFPKGGGCLKPAWEPILLCRKPGPRVLPLGIDGCRVGADTAKIRNRPASSDLGIVNDDSWEPKPVAQRSYPGDATGRWPANVLHDGSDEVLEAFAAFGSDKGAEGKVTVRNSDKFRNAYGEFKGSEEDAPFYGDTGTAARFFYCAKASRAERGDGNRHPTVKPLALMRWMVRLVTPESGRVLDPFAGSGSTLVAAVAEGREAVGIELDPAHCETARARVREAMGTGLLAGVA